MNHTNIDSRSSAPPPRSAARLINELDRHGRRHLTLRPESSRVRRGFSRVPIVPTLAALALLVFPIGLAAQSYHGDLPAPTLDKWVYPFAGSGGGSRTSAPTFGAIGSVGTFDDRDGQFLVGFSLSGTVPSGQGAANYEVTRVRLTLALNFSAADLVTWDGTYDPITTYDPATGASINGDDPGRSIELYGVGYRGGFSALTMLENSPYATGDATAEGARNFYATDAFAGSSRDVSNNIRDAFDPMPFAIGQVTAADLNPDGTMKDGALITFDLNLANPDVTHYVQAAFDTGRLNLLTTSMHMASQGGPATRPEFDTKELGLAGIPARLEFAVNVVPEPGSAGLCLGGALCFGLLCRVRKEVRG